MVRDHPSIELARLARCEPVQQVALAFGHGLLAVHTIVGDGEMTLIGRRPNEGSLLGKRF
jgi:hypothetical protein